MCGHENGYFMKENIEKYIRLGELTGQYLSGEKEEQPEEITEWLNESESNQKLFSEMSTPRFISESQKFHSAIVAEQEYRLFTRRRRRLAIRRLLPYCAAAVVLILLGVAIGIQYLPEKSSIPAGVLYTTAQEGIFPGKQRAILITDANQEINLGEEQQQITSGGNFIASSTTSLLHYQNQPSRQAQEEPVFHRLIVPAGGEYQVILEDGTKIWMNAESELSYPVTFSGNTRAVFLKGEAYFEVAHNKSKPFFVHTPQLNVNVTGTSFNVCAYPKEAESKITLVEGSVNILKEAKIIASLTPGKQINYNQTNGSFSVKDADIESAIAWKNGLFLFQDEPLSSVVSKLGRWYNVNFTFTRSLQEYRYSGSIRRDSPIDSTLHILKLTNEIEFKVKANHEIEITTIQY